MKIILAILIVLSSIPLTHAKTLSKARNKLKIQDKFVHELLGITFGEAYTLSRRTSPAELLKLFPETKHYNKIFFENFTMLTSKDDFIDRITEFYDSSEELELNFLNEDIKKHKHREYAGNIAKLLKDSSLEIPFASFEARMDENSVNNYIIKHFGLIPHETKSIISYLDALNYHSSYGIRVTRDHSSYDDTIPESNFLILEQFCNMQFRAYAPISAMGYKFSPSEHSIFSKKKHKDNYLKLITQTIYQLADYQIRIKYIDGKVDTKRIFKSLKFCLGAIQAATYYYSELDISVPTSMKVTDIGKGTL